MVQNRTQYKTTEEVDNSIDDLVGAIELDLFGNLETGQLNTQIEPRTGIIGAQVEELTLQVDGINRYVTCIGGAACEAKFQKEVDRLVVPKIDNIHNTVGQVRPIFEDLTAIAATNQDYTTANWHIDGTVQGGFTKV